MALSIKDATNLLGFLDEDEIANQSFDSFGAALQKVGFNKQDYFRIGSAIVIFLQHPDLLPGSHQRLAAIYLLYDLYRGEHPSANPFASVFIHLLESSTSKKCLDEDFHHPHINYLVNFGKLPQISPEEKNFLTQLISSPHKDLLKKTPKIVISTKVEDLKVKEHHQEFDVSGLQVSLVEKHSQLSAINKSSASCVVSYPDPFSNLQLNEKDRHSAIESLLAHGNNSPGIQKWKPEFIRPIPPLHPCNEDELVWMNPLTSKTHQFMWDSQMGRNINTGIEVKRLLAKAYRTTLTTEISTKLVDEFNKDPKMLLNSGFTPTKLPLLVENNPLIAIDLLLLLMQSNQITDYLSILVNMEMSLHSMEVFHQQTSHISH